MIEIKLNADNLQEIKNFLDAKRMKTILTRSVNKVGDQALTQANRSIRQIYNISKKRVDAGLTLKKISGTGAALQAVITAKGKSPGLQNFNAKKTKKGVRVKVRKDRGSKIIETAFMAQGVPFGTVDILKPSGVPLVFERTGEEKRLMSKGRYAGTKIKREPIKKLFGPDIVAMIKVAGIGAVEKVVNEKFNTIFNHELQWELSKLK